jgi:hypothetical protein
MYPKPNSFRDAWSSTSTSVGLAETVFGKLLDRIYGLKLYSSHQSKASNASAGVT